MIVLVCGGRDYSDREAVSLALSGEDGLEEGDLLIHGGCRDLKGRKVGADWLADEVARAKGAHVAVVEALWGHYGKHAGPLRNAAMLRLCLPDKLIAFPGGKGTENCIAQAEAAGIPVYRVGRSQDERTAS